MKCTLKTHDVSRFACEDTCGKTLKCGEHECSQPCHEGDCEPCVRSVDRVSCCPCGRISLSQLYGTKPGAVKCPGVDNSKDATSKKGKLGLEKEFSIIKQDNEKLRKSNKSNIEKFAYQTSSDLNDRKAVKSTKSVSVKDVTNEKSDDDKDDLPVWEVRRKCTDAIPTCGSVCGKRLKCGKPGSFHTCQQLCHEGDCPTCPLTTPVR